VGKIKKAGRGENVFEGSADIRKEHNEYKEKNFGKNHDVSLGGSDVCDWLCRWLLIHT
jgi:hypothetical protein